MTKKSAAKSKSKIHLKPHHKVILMGAFSLGVLGLSFLGGLNIGGQNTTPVYYSPYVLNCSSCPNTSSNTKTLCFSPSKKTAWCKMPQPGGSPSDAICVTCPGPNPTVAPTHSPSSGPSACVPFPCTNTQSTSCVQQIRQLYAQGVRFCYPTRFPTPTPYHYPSYYPTPTYYNYPR